MTNLLYLKIGFSAMMTFIFYLNFNFAHKKYLLQKELNDDFKSIYTYFHEQT